jgi:hypothetical protein
MVLRFPRSDRLNNRPDPGVITAFYDIALKLN